MSVLSREVMVLNRNWNPVAIVSVQRALCLVIGTYKSGEPKARILDAYQEFRLFSWKDWSDLKAGDGEAVIRSSKQNCRVPEIILLSRYNKFPQQKVHFSRRTIFRRDENTCQYCGCKPGTENLGLDHLVARSRGGLTTWENIVLSCTDCNRKKGNRLLSEAGMSFYFPGYKPTKPKFAFFSGKIKCKSWGMLLGEAYWGCELVNDNK